MRLRDRLQRARGGADLASLRTRAVREGDSWGVDGQKVFTSNAQNADWIWLACRTDPDAPPHRGISILLVPTGSPGFSWTPIETVGGLTTNASRSPRSGCRRRTSSSPPSTAPVHPIR